MNGFRIDMEDIASNAFITLLRENKLKEDRFISYAKLDDYAKGVLNIGRNQNSWFLYYQDKYFEEKEQGQYVGLRLKEGITEEDLLRKFTGYLPFDLLMAFRDENAIKELILA